MEGSRNSDRTHVSGQVTTQFATSADSGEHWAAEGAWQVAPGVYRVPLPLPLDSLKAVNVYVIETEHGLTMIDGGWAIGSARSLLQSSLAELGYRFDDIRRILVTHIHRDHYTLATVLAHEFGAEVSLGLPEKPALDLMHRAADGDPNPFLPLLVETGALDPSVLVEQAEPVEKPDLTQWAYPHTWIEGDIEFRVGSRTVEAVQTPGHTPGHYVFAERDTGLLFAGDHVLPTITPSIGLTMPRAVDPLGNFMSSLAKIRALPDMRILPAHGPVSPSSHVRVEELLAFHERRLSMCLDALTHGPATAQRVAEALPWTRHAKALADLDVPSQRMAAMETKAHLEVLVARGRVTSEAVHREPTVFTAVRGSRLEGRRRRATLE